MTDTATKAGPLPVRTILLLPNADTRERLVMAAGAPITWRRIDVPDWPREWGWSIPHDRVALEGQWDPHSSVEDYEERCLVLARDGAVVPEGVDRLKRAMGGVGNYDRATLALLDGEREVVRDTRKGLAAVGTIVLLDAEGKEVSSG